jgi:hypothetical protein
LKMK